MIQMLHTKQTRIRLCKGDWSIQRFTPIYDRRFFLTKENYDKYDKILTSTRDYTKTGIDII